MTSSFNGKPQASLPFFAYAYGLPLNESAYGPPLNDNACGLPLNDNAYGLPLNDNAYGLPLNDNAYGPPLSFVESVLVAISEMCQKKKYTVDPCSMLMCRRSFEQK